MALPVLPLLLLGGAAVAALALGKKDAGAAPAGSPAGAPSGAGPQPGAPFGLPQLPGTPGAPPSPFGVPTAGPSGLPVPGAPAFQNPFDRGLTQDQVTAVQTALATENDPTKLDSFSKSLLGLGFPIASAALSAKAAALRLAQGGVPGLFTPISAPAPVAVATPGFPQQGTVTTHDTGPAGDLLVRAQPDASAPAVGSHPHGSTVTVLEPPVNGFYRLATGGFSSAAFITLGAAPAAAPVFTPIGAPGGVTFPPFPQVGSQAIIATQDTGPSGNLNLRSGASTSASVVGSNPHGATVTITGPLTNGFYPIVGPGGAGFSSAQFLAAKPAQTFAAGLAPIASRLGRVRVTANMLGLRAAPNALAPYIAQATKGSEFSIAGKDHAGYLPVRDDAGRTAWASTIYLEGVEGSRTIAGNDVGTGPSIPFADLHMTALALKTALATHGCRSYNEPLVKDFQRVAKAAGIYAGEIDGWYGTVTQAALSKIVGKPAPACFAQATGGPSNPNEYWSPMGV